MDPTLRKLLGSRAQVKPLDRVPSGSPASYVLRAELPFRGTVSAAEALAKRHLTLAEAKRIVEALMLGDTVTVEVPAVEDETAFEHDLRINGVIAERLEAAEPARRSAGR